MAIKKIDSFNKHQNPSTNQNPFDIENYLNVNWDKTQDVINNNADELKTAQNNISKIKQEQITQNTDIENIKKSNEEKAKEIDSLKKELEQTKTNLENYAIHGKSTGEYIHLTDSSETDCRVDVRGNSKQAIREGYNELENTLTDKTVEGITVKVNKDKSVTLNGTATANTSVEISNKPIVLENKDYTYYLKGKTANFNLFVTKENGETQEIITKTDRNIKKVINLGAVTIKNVKVYFQKGATANNVTIYPMIYKGTEEKNYEQYGAMPSLDYPSKIETVKGSVKVTSSSANMLDLTKLSITEKPNVEIDGISANEVTFHTTNNTASSYYLRFKTILKKGTYYARKLYNLIDGTAVTGNNGSGVIFISKSDWSKEFIRLYSNVEKGSFSLQEDTEVYITLMLGKVENGKIKFYNLMLSNSDVNYVEHKEDSVVLPIQEEMLEGDDFDKVNKKEVHVYKKLINLNLDSLKLNASGLAVYIDRAVIDALVPISTEKIGVLCDKALDDTARNVNEGKVDYGIAISSSGRIYIRFKDCTTLEEYKEALKDVEIYYKLAEPKKLDLTQEQIQALEKLDKLKTYKNITSITTDSIAILDVDYKKDLETLLNQITKESEV